MTGVFFLLSKFHHKMKFKFYEWSDLNIERWFELCKYLFNSHIWLNPPKDDHHFFDIYLWMITTLATNKNLYKTGLMCPQDTVKKMKDLLFTMLDLSNLSQAVTQVWFDNMFFEHWQENHWEPSPTKRSFALGVPPHLTTGFNMQKEGTFPRPSLSLQPSRLSVWCLALGGGGRGPLFL